MCQKLLLERLVTATMAEQMKTVVVTITNMKTFFYSRCRKYCIYLRRCLQRHLEQAAENLHEPLQYVCAPWILKRVTTVRSHRPSARTSPTDLSTPWDTRLTTSAHLQELRYLSCEFQHGGSRTGLHSLQGGHECKEPAPDSFTFNELVTEAEVRTRMHPLAAQLHWMELKAKWQYIMVYH